MDRNKISIGQQSATMQPLHVMREEVRPEAATSDKESIFDAKCVLPPDHLGALEHVSHLFLSPLATSWVCHVRDDGCSVLKKVHGLLRDYVAKLYKELKARG